jgi:hypothetical protein
LKLRKSLLRKLFKNKKAVSQTLAAIIMVFLFMTAIAVVWVWLYPAYRNFQTTNTINNVKTYMLRVDESIYDLYGAGPGSNEVLRIDPSYGQFSIVDGRNVSLQFSDAGGTFNQSLLFAELGRLSYRMEGRRSIIISEGDYQYLKGPSLQTHYFINGSNEDTIYQGLTNLTLMRPEQRTLEMELEYRVRVYSWFDSGSNTLSVTINLIQLESKAEEFYFYKSTVVKINYNSSQLIYSASTTIDTDFYVDGSVDPGLDPTERALWFVKPGAVASYDVNIEVVHSQFLFYQ